MKTSQSGGARNVVFTSFFSVHILFVPLLTTFNRIGLLSMLSPIGLLSPFVCELIFNQLKLTDPRLRYDWLYLRAQIGCVLGSAS